MDDSEELIIVNGAKLSLQAAATAFVDAHIAGSPVTGQVTRWNSPICVAVHGAMPPFAEVIAASVKRLAAEAGVPGIAAKPCRANVTIFVTPAPQAVLNEIAAKRPLLLGYHTHVQTKDIATVRYPIQAWYATATEDTRGRAVTDDPEGCNTRPDQRFGGGNCFTVEGSRLGPRLKSNFQSVIVTIDEYAVSAWGEAATADYVAMLVLVANRAPSGCRPLPSIASLLDSQCPGRTDAPTKFDIAMLRGVYRMEPRTSGDIARSDAARWMVKSLLGK